MASQALGGTVFFKIGGTQYSAKGDFEYSVTNFIKKAVVGQDGVHGYTEMPRSPYIKGKLSDIGNVSTQALDLFTDVTITLQCRNGKVIILNDAWFEGETAINTMEGEFPVEFRGMSAQELTA